MYATKRLERITKSVVVAFIAQVNIVHVTLTNAVLPFTHRNTRTSTIPILEFAIPYHNHLRFGQGRLTMLGRNSDSETTLQSFRRLSLIQ
ncbi:hypothetical protein PHET_02491 [Paragonimus heterotremus]|uniref:Uncharacterized protein n=1 Tax=Paragonimus heterotremus TaxID=100268 RepID=A0A8J4TCW2_9TREM|nr:hypothetical protein PHET_02491 [Paragonimus heterotremus]